MKEKKTNHQTGYHKPVKNVTTNYPKDGHKEFCKRCMGYNSGCPVTGTDKPSGRCDIPCFGGAGSRKDECHEERNASRTDS